MNPMQTASRMEVLDRSKNTNTKKEFSGQTGNRSALFNVTNFKTGIIENRKRLSFLLIDGRRYPDDNTQLILELVARVPGIPISMSARRSGVKDLSLSDI